MRVAVNALGIGSTGGESLYFRQLLQNIEEIEHGVECVLITDTSAFDNLNGIDPVKIKAPSALAKAISKSKADILFSPLRTAPRKSSLPLVLLIMELFSFRQEKAQKKGLFGHSPLKEAREILEESIAIVVPSEFVKRELLDLFEVPLNKVVVAPLGVADEFAEPQNCIVEKPYFLVVGSLSERKNIPLLREAFERVASEMTHGLVVVGQPSEHEPQDWGPRVVRIDRVGTTQLVGLYQHSDLVICPSLYEGSGVQVLEALKAGARVAVGRVGGITEVAGDAPIFFNPESVDSLVGAMRRAVSESKADHERRRRSGQQVAHQYTWETTARQTLSAFRRVLAPK